MAKQGMKRPETDRKPKNEVPPVPEIQGKAKRGNVQANKIIPGTHSPELKVFHFNALKPREKPVSDIYPVLDTDLARDNLENDIPDADLNDLV